MEVAESPVAGFLNPPSTAESMTAKKTTKSHKDKKSDERLAAAPTNGTMSSPPPQDNESRPSKRKRDSESGHKKTNKKKRCEAEDDVQGELDPHEPSQTFHQEEDEEDTANITMEVDNTPSKNTRDPDHTASGEASLLEGSQDPATPSEARLKRTRGSRIGAKSQLKVGFFIAEEVKALEEFKIQFCNTHGIAGRTFDAMIQHSERGGEEWPVQTHICNKGEFWNDVYSLIPDRDRRSVYRFMRRHFQDTTQKAHDWTPEQDEELIKLHAQHGPKYAHIAKLLGRSDDDVTQRWKNRLQHRATKKTGAWSEEELRAFMRSLEEYRNLLIASSAEPQKAGKDIWDMDLKSISWGSISNGMDNSRTRQQCADKWRKIQKNVAHLRQTLDPDAVFDPADAVKRYHRWNRGPAGEKSKTFVEEDDEDEDSDDDETRIPSTTPAIVPKLEFAAEQQMDLARVAKEDSVDASPAQSRNGADIEDSDDAEDGLPSSPLSEHSRNEVKKLRNEKKERRRRKKEKKERKRQEAAAAEESAEEIEDPSTPKDKKHKDKKRRKSEANGSELNDLEAESSKKKSRKDKKKNKKPAQEEDVDVDDLSE